MPADARDLATLADALALAEHHARLREGVYGGNGTPRVYYEDAGTYEDVTDLYTILDTETPDGTKDLENAQVEDLATSMLKGYPLSDVQIGVLKRLLEKYSTQIAELRATPDKDGQDYTDVPNPGVARLVTTGDGS